MIIVAHRQRRPWCIAAAHRPGLLLAPYTSAMKGRLPERARLDGHRVTRRGPEPCSPASPELPAVQFPFVALGTGHLRSLSDLSPGGEASAWRATAPRVIVAAGGLGIRLPPGCGARSVEQPIRAVTGAGLVSGAR